MSEPIPVVTWVLPGVWHYHMARMEAVNRRGALALRAVELSRATEWAALSVDNVGLRDGIVRSLFSDRPHAQIPFPVLRRALETALDEMRPDCVLVPGWAIPPAHAALAWCRRRKIPAIVCSDSQAIDAPRIRWREAIKRRIIAQFSAALAGGRRQSDYLVDLGMDRARIMTAYDVVDNDHFAGGADAARAARENVRRRLALPASYFLACSRFVEKKNLGGLLKAYALYRQASGGGRHLVILGEGPLRGALEEQARRQSLTDSVHMPGFIGYGELPAYYGLADAFIHASTVEQWGLVVNEAMAAGLPVLVSRPCGCVPDLVEEGRNGFTFDPANAGQLASLMARVTLPENAVAMGRESRAIIARWTPYDFARNLAAAFEIARKNTARPVTAADRLVLAIMMRLNLR